MAQTLGPTPEPARSRKMKRLNSMAVWTMLAALGAGGAAALAQTAAPDNGASMVKPPAAGSGPAAADNPNNPDNMPIKRPTQPTRDRMSKAPPASAAQAK